MKPSKAAIRRARRWREKVRAGEVEPPADKVGVFEVYASGYLEFTDQVKIKNQDSNDQNDD